jgi:hypothetical protein
MIQRVGVSEESSPRPFTVYQNFPNPVRSSTTIRFVLPAAERVTLRIFDVMGRLVRTLADRHPFEPGMNALVWDGTNDFRAPVASGIYFYGIQTGSLAKIRRMLVIR